jgi:hypothetical protein
MGIEDQPKINWKDPHRELDWSKPQDYKFFSHRLGDGTIITKYYKLTCKGWVFVAEYEEKDTD